MSNAVEDWLVRCPAPVAGILEAGLLAPLPDYTAIARVKAELVERTGLLGVASVWGGRQLVGRHFLGPAWDGSALAVAISEPKVGAHPKLLTTRADKTAAGYRITGEKAWVSNGPSADAIIVFAITAQDQGRKRYSAFIVPRDAPGVTMSSMPGFHALRPSQHCLVTLDGVEVPDTAMLGDPGVAYERFALPFRDVEDAVGTFAILGALRHAAGLAAGADPTALGAIVALTAVFAAGAETVVATLDAGRLRTGDATLVGLRVLAQEIVARLKALALPAMDEILSDLDAVLGIARGPRLARQTHLGEAALRRT
jgi:acyl-CoA dehydrogenase